MDSVRERALDEITYALVPDLDGPGEVIAVFEDGSWGRWYPSESV